MKFLRLSVSVVSAALILMMAVSSFATEVFLPRSPAISADAETVVFSFQGDLWSVPASGGQAMRLTAHEAYDTSPLFSPDGKMLAFASDRYGDQDIFIMPAAGGAPQRLTFASLNDRPGAFSPDGREMFFASGRCFEYPMSRQIYRVPVSGGTPLPVTGFFADEVATYDGETFILAQGRVKPARVRYRGSYQREIYSWKKGGDPVKLTENRGYDYCPMIAPDGTIYWVGDDNKAKTANVFRMNADGSEKRQLTSFKGDGIRSAQLSRDGSTVVIERETSLYLMNTEDGKTRRMEIQVAADLLENPVVTEVKTDDANEIAVAGVDDELALAVDGEIIFLNEELGGRAVVAVPGPWLEESISFKPGSADTLLFVTDRYGERTVCLLVSDDPEESSLRLARQRKIIKLTDDDKPSYDPAWSPDGKSIAYVRGNTDLRVMDSDGDNDRVLLKHWGGIDFSWSPDSAWLAYSCNDANYNTDIWVMPVEGGDAVNITKHPDYDESPIWSADGRMLAWTSSRNSPGPRSGQMDMYFVYLLRADHERTKEQWEIWEKTRDKPGKEEKDEADKDDESEEPEEVEEEKIEVLIDFDEIHVRGRRVSDMDGRASAIAIDPKGDKFYFTASEDGDRDLFSVDRFGEERENVTSGGANPADIVLDTEGETFHFLRNGKPASVGAGGGDVETVDFSARITIDRPALRLQVLDEAWRTMRDNFYDENMHGVDWKDRRGKYGKWVQKVAHDVDFSDVVNFMLGELNASHMGYYGRIQSPGDYGTDGYLGLQFDPTHTGDGLLVKYVVPHGPCDLVESRLLEGDLLLSVDGRPVSAKENLFQALETMEGVPVWVEVKRDGEEMEFQITPSTRGRVWSMLYFDAEDKNRAYTDDKSDGRVGYVHIQGMGFSEVQRFQQNLFAAADGREALVIDVRNNGGGWTTDLLLTILTQPVHAYTIGRNGEIGYPQTERQPFYRWSKPIAVICSEGSYSNAEIFSHAVKSIGRGPVIGMETGGNVISTWGFGNRYRGYTRLPGRGWFVWGDEAHPERNHKPQEGVHEATGCIPDYIVDKTLADQLHGRDPQLDKAIELMIEAADAERAKPQRDDR